MKTQPLHLIHKLPVNVTKTSNKALIPWRKIPHNLHLLKLVLVLFYVSIRRDSLSWGSFFLTKSTSSHGQCHQFLTWRIHAVICLLILVFVVFLFDHMLLFLLLAAVRSLSLLFFGYSSSSCIDASTQFSILANLLPTSFLTHIIYISRL